MEVKVKSNRDISKEISLIPEYIFKTLKLSEDTLYNIHLGQLSEKSYVAADKAQRKNMYLSKNVYDKLMPYENIILNIWRRGKNIYLGPVVGIFETPRFLKEMLNGEMTFYEMQHMKASIDEHCLCYYFSPEDINWEEKKIKGITYFPDLDKWEYFYFPMPQVIYDEGIFLNKVLKPMAKPIRRRFRKDPNIHVINCRNSLDKWDLGVKLLKHDDMKKYVPETIIYNNFDDLVNMLEKYKFVFLKSIYGSNGTEVLSIESYYKEYRLNFCSDNTRKVKDLTIGNIRDLKHFVDEYTKEEEFVIQQGINLLKFDGHNMDLRIMVMKDGNGKWTPIFNLARIAKGDGTITNISLGGSLVLYEQIYDKLSSPFCKGKIPDGKTIDDITIKIAECIEKEYGSFGEIGIDIAVDVYGHVWVLEANAKPDKKMNLGLIDIYGRPLDNVLLEDIEEYKNEEGILPQALNTFRYAKFLAKNKGLFY